MSYRNGEKKYIFFDEYRVVTHKLRVLEKITLWFVRQHFNLSLTISQEKMENIFFSNPAFKSSVSKISNKQFTRTLLVLCFCILSAFSAQAQETIGVYVSAPGVQEFDLVSNPPTTNYNPTTENFSGFSGLPDSDWATPSFSSAIGTYTQTAGNSAINADDQYGSGTGNYLSIGDGGLVTLDLDDESRYFGFAWPAGNGGNTIEVFRNGVSLFTMNTDDVVAFLPNNSTSRTALNGDTYTTDQYYGKPGTGQNNNEPYAYIHIVASSGLSFDEVRISHSGGGAFENDNHTVLFTGDQPDTEGDDLDWIEVYTQTGPDAVDDESLDNNPGDTVNIDVLDNDTPGENDEETFTLEPESVVITGSTPSGSSLSSDGRTLTVPGEGEWTVNSSTGVITFEPETDFLGDPTPIQYRVSDSGGIASNIANVTVTYIAFVEAVDDSAGPVDGINGTDDVLNVLDNDSLDGELLDPEDITLTEVDSDPELTLNPDGSVDVEPGTPGGTYTVDYQICENDDQGTATTNCDTATATVTVQNAIIATDDSAGPVDGITGEDDVLNVLDNDSLAGEILDPNDITLTEVDSDEELTFNPDGSIDVEPGTTGGTYTVDYQICENDDQGTATTNCDTATATVTVQSPIIATDDSAGPINGATGADDVLNVLDNDSLNGELLDPNDIVLTEVDADDELTFNSDGSIDVEPGTPGGTYTVDYQICEADDTENCDTATATVTVQSSIIATDDSAGPIDGTTGADDVLNVLDNDSLNGELLDPNDIVLTEVDSDEELTFNSDGSIDVEPGTPGGTYTVDYQICEANDTENCDTATATVDVLSTVSIQLTGGACWRMLSSPVEGVTYEDMLGNLWTQGVPGSDDPTSDIPNVYTWSSSSSGNDVSNWVEVDLNESDPIPAGNGFLFGVMEEDSDDLPITITVSGMPRTGPVSADVNSTADGWSLVGNPYPNGVDFSELTTNSLTDVAYIWDRNSGNWVSTTSDGFGDITDGIIAPGQGFFVQNTSNATTPSLQFTESSQESGGEFYGKEKQQRKNFVRLEVEGEHLSSSMWVRFSENGSMETTYGDAIKLEPLSEDYAMFASRKKDGTLLDVGHFPIHSEKLQIPVSFTATQPGSYTIKADQFDLPAERELIFTDTQTGQSFELNEEFEYTFTVTLSAKKSQTPDGDDGLGYRCTIMPEKAKSSGIDRFRITDAATSEQQVSEIPQELGLSQNYPNPFNPTTSISYQIPVDSNVNLSVFDMNGRQVATLVDGQVSAGRQQVRFDASRFASGVYMYRLTATNGAGRLQVITRKLTLVK